MIPEEIQRLLEDAESFLADGLQNENLSPKTREQRDAILFGFQQVKTRYHLEFLPRGDDLHDASFGRDSSDENQSWSLAPSMTSDVSLPSDFQDEGSTVKASSSPSTPAAPNPSGAAARSPLRSQPGAGCGSVLEALQRAGEAPGLAVGGLGFSKAAAGAAVAPQAPAQPAAPGAGLEEFVPRPIQEAGNILKQGYLEKRSRDHGFFGSEWQKRWCVLNRKTFYYYANEKSKQPKGTFSIENYSARLASHLRKDSRRKCCFELVCPGRRTYEFTARSPAEAEDWVDQIQFLLKDLTSLTIPCDEDDEEETYNDVDSSDSLNAASHNTTMNQDEPDDGMGEDDIYEVLPEEEPDAPFAEDIEDGGSRQRDGNPPRDFANYYQGAWDCSAEHPDELSFRRGDLIYVLSKEYNVYGWWVGELNNVVGIVPKDYLVAAYDLEER